MAGKSPSKKTSSAKKAAATRKRNAAVKAKAKAEVERKAAAKKKEAAAAAKKKEAAAAAKNAELAAAAEKEQSDQDSKAIREWCNRYILGKPKPPELSSIEGFVEPWFMEKWVILPMDKRNSGHTEGGYEGDIRLSHSEQFGKGKIFGLQKPSQGPTGDFSLVSTHCRNTLFSKLDWVAQKKDEDNYPDIDEEANDVQFQICVSDSIRFETKLKIVHKPKPPDDTHRAWGPRSSNANGPTKIKLTCDEMVGPGAPLDKNGNPSPAKQWWSDNVAVGDAMILHPLDDEGQSFRIKIVKTREDLIAYMKETFDVDISGEWKR
uniref:Uncharacterized protein n=1 Tax=uncultured marine group II/III euryarchaeote KM3_192_D09 TaxID=1457965 RepID=A0A075GXE1_9EURY|nr:hypothetical protein [uncultured marine group II/III euryarchaeote KM3_192_D09]